LSKAFLAQRFLRTLIPLQRNSQSFPAVSLKGAWQITPPPFTKTMRHENLFYLKLRFLMPTTAFQINDYL